MNNFLEFNYEVDDEYLENFEKTFNQLLEITKDKLNINKTLSLSVNYIDENKSIELNTKYRNKNYVGDVISFPIDDDFGIYEQMDFKEIGDIFITPSEAKKKSILFNHTILEEMSWLFVHGLLHLLGYDHETNEYDAQVMFELTEKILKEINIIYIMPISDI